MGSPYLSFPLAYLGLWEQILRFAQNDRYLKASYTPQFLKEPENYNLLAARSDFHTGSFCLRGHRAAKSKSTYRKSNDMVMLSFIRFIYDEIGQIFKICPIFYPLLNEPKFYMWEARGIAPNLRSEGKISSPFSGYTL